MSILRKYHQNRVETCRIKDLLQYSKKVLKYRKHLMSTATFNEIDKKRSALKLALISKNFHEASNVFAELEPLLRENGGDIYPCRAINDNAEVLLVASIIAIAIRVFFLQTFQIPTNSMYPTYHGVTVILHNQAASKSRPAKLYDKIFNGTTSFNIISEHTGSLEIPLFANSNLNRDTAGIVQFELHKIRKFFGLIPSEKRVYSIKIGNNVQKIHLPYDYSIDSAFLQKFGSGATSWQKLYDEHPEKFRVTDDTIFFKPGYSVGAGENLINFDIVCGDMLFVNKLTNHFRRPKIGEAIVFRTGKIKNIPSGPHYFIKRLVGKPGDEIQIKNGVLLRNHQLISGNEIFKKEANKTDKYPGYTASGSLKNNNIVRVPPEKYFVLGDNSPDSGDSRFWGFVPQTEVTGSPLFIFYPFNRAGFCK